MNPPTLPQVVSALAAGRPESEQVMMTHLLATLEVGDQPNQGHSNPGLVSTNKQNTIHPSGGERQTTDMRQEHNFPNERAQKAYKAGRKAGTEAFLDKQPKPAAGESWWLKGWQEAYDEGVELVSRRHRKEVALATEQDKAEGLSATEQEPSPAKLVVVPEAELARVFGADWADRLNCQVAEADSGQPVVYPDNKADQATAVMAGFQAGWTHGVAYRHGQLLFWLENRFVHLTNTHEAGYKDSSDEFDQELKQWENEEPEELDVETLPSTQLARLHAEAWLGGNRDFVNKPVSY